jgi:hypothetical protein
MIGLVLGLLCLTPLSTIFQLYRYRGGQEETGVSDDQHNISENITIRNNTSASWFIYSTYERHIVSYIHANYTLATYKEQLGIFQQHVRMKYASLS